MEETLRTIGIDTKRLNSKPIHNRIETESILGITNQTLNTFKKKGWIKPSKFKNKVYYTTDSIIECIGYQLGTPNNQISNQNKDWFSIWE